MAILRVYKLIKNNLTFIRMTQCQVLEQAELGRETA